MKTITPDLQQAIAALYADLNWSQAQQAGMNRRVCGQPWPQTTQQANAVYCALEAMLLRLMRPHWAAFSRVVDTLHADGYLLTAWERQFIADIRRKLAGKVYISPQMIKKVREIAHKWGVECGFPSLRELAAALKQPQQLHEETPAAALNFKKVDAARRRQKICHKDRPQKSSIAVPEIARLS